MSENTVLQKQAVVKPPVLDKKTLQGNILKGHGRPFASHILVRFNLRFPNTARAWLKNFAKKKVTSAYEQELTAQIRKSKSDMDRSVQETLFAMVLLSAEGYRVLDLEKYMPTDKNALFVDGMGSRWEALGDPPPQARNSPYDHPIHAMLILAHADYETLKVEERAILQQLRRFCSIVHVEEGKRLVRRFLKGTNGTNGNTAIVQQSSGLTEEKPVEYFGFADGVSQTPAPAQTNGHYEIASSINGNSSELDPFNHALLQETGMDTYGSFCVFRKLEQNISLFREQVTHLVKTKQFTEEDSAGASIIGQYPNGTTAKVPKENTHVRKMQNLAANSPQIVRRGMPYNDADRYLYTASGETPPLSEQGAGLLFISFQADLDSFERLQRGAIDKTAPGADALLGREHALVTLKGGEYFFAPSLSFLNQLEVDAFTLEDGQVNSLSNQEFILKIRELYRADEFTLKKFGSYWAKGDRMAAIETLGVDPPAFDRFYAYLVPLMSLLDAHKVEPYQSQKRRTVWKLEAPDEPLRKKVIEAFAKTISDPKKLERFAQQWSENRNGAIESIGLSPEEHDTFYEYLMGFGVNFYVFFPL
ncbi:MAG: Dyp-type peroxidase [Anaerolineae bacterium]|nr:Dyp-type peroxidase [Anaerolineae bacterium]